jgi:RNA polymerase sigma-70 factor (ECF subfamily)
VTDSALPFEPKDGRKSPPAAVLEPRHAIYEAEIGYVWNALRRFGVVGSDVEDLTQEVFLRAFRDWGRYDASRAVRPWLCGIAYHVAIDHLRRQAHVAAAREELPDVASEDPAPDHAAALSQERRVLERMLGTLDLDRRAVLVMHELLGHSAPEIAEALEVPLNTVYSRLRLARQDFDAAVAAWKQQERRP